MPEQPQGYTNDLLEVCRKFAKGTISLEVFIKMHNYGERTNWKHMKYFVREPYLFDQFIRRLPAGLRLKALLGVHELTFENLNHMGLKGAERYIGQGFPNTKIRGISNKLLKLAIVTDIPMEFLTLDDEMINFESTNSFYEYKYNQSGITDFKSVIESTLWKPSYRMIEGIVINTVDSFIFLKQENITIARLDRRLQHFCLQFFLTSQRYLDPENVKRINKALEDKVKYVIQTNDPFRQASKVSFYGCYNNDRRDLDELDNYIEEILETPSNFVIFPL